jgi:class 3 adenylate cyclase/predicted ATPase
MTFDEILAQVRDLVQSKGRVAYRALKRRFEIDDEYLEDLKAELIDAEQVARDEEGKVLVWAGKEQRAPHEEEESSKPQSARLALHSLLPAARAEGERRQLTVMFCDLVGSTALSEQLDPEELREVVGRYQEACTAVIQRYAGHIAQHLGDGLLVYFGYPVAHEDDAQRAVRAGLEIIAALQSSPLQHRQLPQPIQVRIGIHTGLVVIGEIGSSEKREILALGETPNLAARVQGMAEPDTVVMSAVTQRLVQGLFECEDLGPQTLKGISVPVSVYRIIRESTAQSRFEVAVSTGLTPLVGRDEELTLLQRRWTQAKEGAGQVVLLSGEAGIGKSRLVQTLKEQALAEGTTRIEFRCSPYHQNSALYPIIDHLYRLLQFQREEPPQVKLNKLQQTLATYRFPQADTLPLLATLLSLPQAEGVPPLTLSPQKQKQKTQEILVAWIMAETQKAAVYCAWEDLHWVDPSTLEVLTLFLEQIPTTRVFSILTFRPEFTAPWSPRSYFTQLTLNRLGRPYVEAMVEKVTSGKSLPADIVQQIVTKTDGVPLFVEELTKMVLESGLVREENGRYVGTHGGASIPPLAIPSTLQDSLMARLDRLAPVREIAQLGSALGREFSYELLQAVSSMDDASLQQGLRQLVEAELVYQRGLPPHATYLFKHALIQDTAYQSLLKSRRQQLHQQIAQVLAEQFPETVETQPELLAHHYIEAGLKEQAIPYWQKAGQRASQRSANVEAIVHLSKGLELLKMQPDTTERSQQELRLQLALGVPLMATKGYSAPEVEQTYARSRELCQQSGETPQLFPALFGLVAFHLVRGEFQTARDLSEQLLRLAQSVQEPALLVSARHALGQALFFQGELVSAREHLARGIAVYDPQQHHSLALLYGTDPGAHCLLFIAQVLWHLGYPDQALKRVYEALSLAQKFAHPFNLAFALNTVAAIHQFRREIEATQKRAEETIALCIDQGFALVLAIGTIRRGWALVQLGQGEAGTTQIRQGIDAHKACGAILGRSYYLLQLAEAYGKAEKVEEGLTLLAEALELIDKGGRVLEAELYRLKGELTLQQANQKSKGKRKKGVRSSSPQPPSGAEREAEQCFLKAIEVAQRQQAKSLELRATVSSARLWQAQGKRSEAHHRLSEIYNWFTEGFDTKDLQEAKGLIEELSQ